MMGKDDTVVEAARAVSDAEGMAGVLPTRVVMMVQYVTPSGSQEMMTLLTDMLLWEALGMLDAETLRMRAQVLRGIQSQGET